MRGVDAGAAGAVPEDPTVRSDRVAPTPGRRRVEEDVGAVNGEVERRYRRVPADCEGRVVVAVPPAPTALSVTV